MLSSNQIVYGSLIYSARKVFAQTPETISRMPVNRVGHHAKRDRAKLVCCELLGHERGDVAVLARVVVRAGNAPDGSSRNAIHSPARRARVARLLCPRCSPGCAAASLWQENARRRHRLRPGRSGPLPQSRHWASAFENASSAISAATPLLNDALPERRLVATHLLCQLDLPEAQKALLSLLADPDLRVALLAFSALAGVASTFVSSDLFEQHERVLTLVARHPLDEAGTAALELLLTRKRSDLRRGILTLLLQESDEAALFSAERLLTATHPLQRLAGLEMLNGLATDGCTIEQSRDQARRYSASRALFTTEEATLINAILAVGQGTGAPTRENVLGLISPEACTPRVLPRPRAFDLDTPAAYGCLRELDALVEEHRTTPVTAHSWRGSEEIVLGDLSWRFPFPKDAASIEEDVRTQLPLARVWLDWECE